MAGLANPRIYFLPLLSGCFAECPVCAALGCRNPADRDEVAFLRALSRAKSGEYDTIAFPAHLLIHPEREAILSRVRELGFESRLRIHSEVLKALTPELRSFAREIGLEIILSASAPEFDFADFPEAEYTLLVSRGEDVIGYLKTLPSPILRLLRFHFSPFLGERNLSVRESFLLLEKVRRDFPKLLPAPPAGLEIWDSRISPDLCLEGNEAPLFAYELGSPEISVVIPSYNSGPLLRNVIRHLLDQSLPRERFEIIVVDDGSTDGSAELIRNFVAPEAGALNFKYLYFPRVSGRTLGDGRFRAGISRNLGVKHARGRLLAFLDSDMIAPPHHLEELIELHRSYDVIQYIRRHLKNSGADHEQIAYRDVDASRDSYILERSYWGRFFATTNWESLPYFWKYTCTYGLSLKTQDFKNVGWFRKTFVFYGFEDTDLGYRLARAGKRFHLRATALYHLTSKQERREYRGSELERHLLLSRTAKIFYLNTLDPAIYLHFSSFMRGEGRTSRILADALNGVRKSLASFRREARSARPEASRSE